MKAIVKICICAVVAAALIATLCVLLIPSTRWRLPELLSFADIGSGRYEQEDAYHVGAEAVTEPVDELELHWSSGKIVITTHTGSDIRMTETGYRSERQQLRWRVKDGKLIIREQASGLNWSLPGKTLELSLPEGDYDELSIDTASAAVSISGALRLGKLDVDSASGNLSAAQLTVDELSFDSASGGCTLTDCTVAEFEMETASGSALLTGSFDRVSMDAASGDLELHSAVTPREISVDAVSSRVRLYLPADAEFSAALDSVSGDLSVEDFSGTYRDGDFICGSGARQYQFTTVSGDVEIRKES